MIDLEIFGRSMRKARNATGYSQVEVAKMIQRTTGMTFSASNLSRYECGQWLPTLNCFLQLCQVYFPSNPLAGMAWILNQSIREEK